MRVPQHITSYLNREATAIRRPCSSVEFMQPCSDRANWLNAAQKGMVFNGAWLTETDLGSRADITSRIYHRQSANCDRIGVMAVVENAEETSGGYLTIEASAGAGTGETVGFFTDQTAAAGMANSDPLWQIWFKTIDTGGSGVQYHTIQTVDLNLRQLCVFEMPRNLLIPASEDCIQEINGSYAGILNGRMICDDSSGGAGLQSLYYLISIAANNTDRAGGGIITPDNYQWGTTTTAPSWQNIADTPLGTSGFGFKHRARRLKVGDTTVTYQVYFYGGTASESGATATFRLTSSVTSDYAEVSYYQTEGWATDTVTVACDQDDTLTLTANTTNASYAAVLNSVQWFE